MMRKTNAVFHAANTMAETAYKKSRMSIAQLVIDLKSSDNPFKDYFLNTGDFLLHMMDHYDAIQDDAYFEKPFEVLLEENHKLYQDITEPGYQRSFVNPAYAVSIFGKEMGQFLSGVAYLFRSYVGMVYESRLFDMNELNELYLLLYSLVAEKGVEDFWELKEAVRDHMLRAMDTVAEISVVRMLTTDFDVYSHIVDSYDQTDLRYLFRYGMYVGTNEIEQAKFILTLPEEKIKKIADTYTEAYFRGFERNNIRLDNKKSVQVIYHLGFERVMKKAYENFAEKGLKPFAFYHLRGEQRPRLYNTRPNKQMEYDHRFSDAVYLDEHYVDTYLESMAKIMSRYAKHGEVFSGLALFEIFGEAPFSPENKDANMVHDEATAAASARMKRLSQQEYRKYVKGDDYSFTINDYPLPSIGDRYKEIFDATIEVNTLEESVYEEIQSKIIDAMDKSVYVHVTGRKGNETDVKVALHPLKDPEKETIFDNCTADVNVPVGEVYTTPVLRGTNGLLHVKEVYLTGLRYVDLKIRFEDGMVTDYTCSNFETEEENRNFVRETLMHPHDTLPLGEFAIGTNTVAYMMAKKYDINALLPILIGEKTGPHFAIGDTCFAWAEDAPVYNSNGKEIIARDNERSILRKEDPEKAYTYKHTDITIPYHELDKIIGYGADGTAHTIIDNGRFVLEGTQLLNEPFDKELS